MPRCRALTSNEDVDRRRGPPVAQDRANWLRGAERGWRGLSQGRLPEDSVAVSPESPQARGN